MSTATSYPLTWPQGWKREPYPNRSRFSHPTIYASVKKVYHELQLFGVGDWNVIVSSNLHLRNDGLPRSNQREPEDRGVAIYFKYKDEQMVIACDTFDLVGCNLRAVAKTVEAMRGIDRWGCSELLNRAFTGFKALPDAGTESQTHWTDVLNCLESDSMDEIKRIYRELAKRCHPDHGGSTEGFQLLQWAYDQAVKENQ